tara:strand:+ start:1213 stop:1476 length:264 start_codon:yes stop_codon:yes gene_type:complete
MVIEKFTVKNSKGLHMRPAEQLVRVASKYKSEVRLIKDNIPVNGKSIMGVMMLAAEYGSSLTIEIDGPDENDAMENIAEMFHKDLEP